MAGSATSLLLYQVLGRRQRAALAPGPFIFTPSSVWQHFRRETKPVRGGRGFFFFFFKLSRAAFLKSLAAEHIRLLQKEPRHFWGRAAPWAGDSPHPSAPFQAGPSLPFPSAARSLSYSRECLPHTPYLLFATFNRKKNGATEVWAAGDGTGSGCRCLQLLRARWVAFLQDLG